MSLTALVAGGIGSLLTMESALATPDWYNCYTRETWTAEKQAWCEQLSQLQSLTYSIPDLGDVTLQNGRYDSAANQVLVTLLEQPGQVTFGDRNGDGQLDSGAALLAVNTGGSGVFVYLVGLAATDEGLSPTSMAALGDRVQPQQLDLAADTITVDMIAHGPDQPSCCPTWSIQRVYQFDPANPDLILKSSWGEVSGTLTYRERMALPPGATITVSLVDVSRADAPSILMGQQTIITSGNQVPIPFTLRFDPDAIQPQFTYAVQARIEIDDRLLFITDTQYPVLTGDHPSQVELVLRRTP